MELFDHRALVPLQRRWESCAPRPSSSPVRVAIGWSRRAARGSISSRIIASMPRLRTMNLLLPMSWRHQRPADRGRESTMQSGFRFPSPFDTDRDNKWQSHRIRSVANIDWPPPLQHLFARYGARPTYLLTHAVAIDAKAVASLKELMKICPGE